VVGAPGLNSYHAVRSDLGQVVQAIKRNLERTPPQLAPGDSPGNGNANGAAAIGPTYQQQQQQQQQFSMYGPPYSVQNAASSYAAGFPSSSRAAPVTYGAYPSQSQASAYATPSSQSSVAVAAPSGVSVASTPKAAASSASQSVLSEVKELKLNDLEELNSDPRALKKFVRTLKNHTMESLDCRAKEARARVDQLVEDNQKLRQEVEAKSQALSLSLSTRTSLSNDVAGLESARVKGARESNTLSAISRGLAKEVDKVEEESESVADKFLSGNLPTDEFLSQYLQLRGSHHRQKAKLDDVLQADRQLQMYGGSTSQQWQLYGGSRVQQQHSQAFQNQSQQSHGARWQPFH